MNKYYKIEESAPDSDEPSLIICLNSDAALQHDPPKVSGKGIDATPITGDNECLDRWKNGLGDRLANLLGLSPDKRWSLKEFPKNYVLYSAKPCTTNTLEKGVLYEHGPAHRFWRRRQFNSQDEFLLHLYWLCTNSREAVGRCLCCRCTSRPQGDVKAYLLELERSKRLQRSKAARNDDDDDENEKPSKKAKIQEVELYSSSQASSIFVEQSTEVSKEIKTLFSGLGQASEEAVIISSRSKRTRASKTANLSTKPAITRASKASKVLSTSSTITRASEVKTLSTRSTITLNSSPQASLDVGLEPSSQYGFSIQPIDVEPNKSHKIKTHLINHDVIPSSLPHYRYLELVWFKLKETIEIPSSYINDERSLKIKLWPAIVLSLGSKLNEKPKPFYIRLLGIHQLEKLVFDHDLLPWRSYDYEKLRSQLGCLREIDERIEESIIYKDFETTMTNLSYGIQISIYLHSIISVSEDYESDFIDSSQEENYGNQIWLGAEVLSVGDFIILNKTENQNKNKGSSKVKEDEKTCEVMLIGEIQETCQTHKNKQALYKLKGHLFTALISKTRKLIQTVFGKDNKDYDGDVALQPYLKNQGKSEKVLKRNSTSGFEFDLIADNKSGKKVSRFTNVVIGRMYSLNHLGRSLDPERIQNSSMSEVCGLRVEEDIEDRLYIPSRTAAISLAIQTAREDFERDGFKFKYHCAYENWEKKETEMSLFLE